jgi:starch synthase
LTKEKEKVWIFTFEYAGIAKVGGLGEVPANQAKYLVDQFEVTVFIPSHGQIERLKILTELKKLSYKCKVLAKSDPLGPSVKEDFYEISYYKAKINNVDIVLLSGDNSFTRKYIDDDNVYNPEIFNEKLLIFSLGMRNYVKNLIANQKVSLPDIIHMHDYHVVIPFIGVKQELKANNLNVRSIITFHLLTWPRYNLDFYYECGVDNMPLDILLKKGFKLMNIREIFALCKKSLNKNLDDNPPTIEQVGALISDLITTVSNSYLHSDIIPNLGQNLIEFKSDFVWDGCDWDYDEIYQMVLYNFGDDIRKLCQISEESTISREDMKKYLLTYKISHLSQSPLIHSRKVLEVIEDISNGNTFMKDGNVANFKESGPLIISTGRISRQKGFETIFEALPKILDVIPNAKVLLLLLPTEYSLNEIKNYAQVAKKYPDNLRIIFGLTADIFYFAHIAADVYCALSRWEPFGIIALEAMSAKLPIIATKIGGLQETIIDIRDDSDNGTGILIEKDNPSQFANALITIFKLSEIALNFKLTGNIDKDDLDLITDEKIKSQILLDAMYYEKIKDNCYKRVKQNFRWNIVSKKLELLYLKLSEL